MSLDGGNLQNFLPYITGAGGALVVLALWVYAFFTGSLHSDSEFQSLVDENTALKKALETERTANNELARAGGVTNKLIGALVEVAVERHEAKPSVLPGASGDLTPKS